jgi:hypothetical protein
MTTIHASPNSRSAAALSPPQHLQELQDVNSRASNRVVLPWPTIERAVQITMWLKLSCVQRTRDGTCRCTSPTRNEGGTCNRSPCKIPKRRALLIEAETHAGQQHGHVQHGHVQWRRARPTARTAVGAVRRDVSRDLPHLLGVLGGAQGSSRSANDAVHAEFTDLRILGGSRRGGGGVHTHLQIKLPPVEQKGSARLRSQCGRFRGVAGARLRVVKSQVKSRERSLETLQTRVNRVLRARVCRVVSMCGVFGGSSRLRCAPAGGRLDRSRLGCSRLAVCFGRGRLRCGGPALGLRCSGHACRLTYGKLGIRLGYGPVSFRCRRLARGRLRCGGSDSRLGRRWVRLAAVRVRVRARVRVRMIVRRVRVRVIVRRVRVRVLVRVQDQLGRRCCRRCCC